jgi:hypothetical protein
MLDWREVIGYGPEAENVAARINCPLLALDGEFPYLTAFARLAPQAFARSSSPSFMGP